MHDVSAMKKTAIVINWVMLALFGVAFIVLMVRFPSRSGIGTFIPLLPYATALLAFKSVANRGIAGTSIFFNALVVVGGVIGLVASVTGKTDEPVVAGIVSVLLLAPAALNCLLLKWTWDRARVAAQSANELLQATRAESRAPEA